MEWCALEVVSDVDVNPLPQKVEEHKRLVTLSCHMGECNSLFIRDVDVTSMFDQELQKVYIAQKGSVMESRKLFITLSLLIHPDFQLILYCSGILVS